MENFIFWAVRVLQFVNHFSVKENENTGLITKKKIEFVNNNIANNLKSKVLELKDQKSEF